MSTEDLPPQTVGQRLKFARSAIETSQAKLAAELGIAQSTLADYEREKYDVPRPVCLAMEYRFGINHLWLLTGEGNPFLPTKPEAEARGRPVAGAAAVRPVVVTDPSELERLETLEGRDRFYAVPYLRDAASAGQGLIVEDAVEGYCIIHERAAPRPENLRCLRISGDSMAPLLPEGSIVGVDITLKHPRVVDGKIICARSDEGHVIKRLQLQQRYALLFSESENHDRYPPIVISLKSEEDFIVGQVVWAWIDLR